MSRTDTRRVHCRPSSLYASLTRVENTASVADVAAMGVAVAAGVGRGVGLGAAVAAGGGVGLRIVAVVGVGVAVATDMAVAVDAGLPVGVGAEGSSPPHAKPSAIAPARIAMATFRTGVPLPPQCTAALTRPRSCAGP